MPVRNTVFSQLQWHKEKALQKIPKDLGPVPLFHQWPNMWKSRPQRHLCSRHLSLSSHSVWVVPVSKTTMVFVRCTRKIIRAPVKLLFHIKKLCFYPDIIQLWIFSCSVASCWNNVVPKWWEMTSGVQPFRGLFGLPQQFSFAGPVSVLPSVLAQVSRRIHGRARFCLLILETVSVTNHIHNPLNRGRNEPLEESAAMGTDLGLVFEAF